MLLTATSASDHRPSAPWVLSSVGKLIRSDIYTGPTSCLIVPQTFSLIRFLSAISIFLNALSSISRVDTPLTADWLQVCFGTRPDCIWKIAFPALNSDTWTYAGVYEPVYVSFYQHSTFHGPSINLVKLFNLHCRLCEGKGTFGQFIWGMMALAVALGNMPLFTCGRDYSSSERRHWPRSSYTLSTMILKSCGEPSSASNSLSLLLVFSYSFSAFFCCL